MGYKKDVKKKKHSQKQRAKTGSHERTARDVAMDSKNEHDKFMKGKKTVLVPHPTSPRAYIEKVINK